MVAIRHIGITVNNIKKLSEFYLNLLNFTEHKTMLEEGEFIDGLAGIKNIKVTTAKLLDASNGKVMLELLEYHSHPEKFYKPRRLVTNLGISHFALTVENLDNLYKKLSTAGIHFNAPPATSPDGFAKVAFCRDPENNLIELVEELK